MTDAFIAGTRAAALLCAFCLGFAVWMGGFGLVLYGVAWLAGWTL